MALVHCRQNVSIPDSTPVHQHMTLKVLWRKDDRNRAWG